MFADQLRTILILILPERAIDLMVAATHLLRAWLRNETFYCGALQGESNYNICINSDLTVSCNCQDYDGSGHLGSIESNTLREVFEGRTAAGFRSTLARRRFPIPTCLRCSDLKFVSRKEIDTLLASFTTPREGIMAENTVACNLSCLGCDRKGILASRKRTSMSLEDVAKVAAVVKEYGIKSLSFLNLGEPFLSPRILEELTIIRGENPDLPIMTSTNGVHLDSDEKREAALLMDQIFVSIDGPSQDVVEKYQVQARFDASYQNLRKLVEYRNERGRTAPLIEWKYVLFRWNDRPEQVEKAIALAREAGVDMISFWPGRAPGRYKSLNYPFNGYFRRLGAASWKGREIDLRRQGN